MTRSLVIVMIVAAACGKKAGDSNKAAEPPKPAVDVAGVNALVPASLKDKLVFEQRDLVEERGHGNVTYTLAAPKGWEQKMKAFPKVSPPDSANLGFMTDFGVASNCDGECAPKDWAQVADKVLFKQFSTNGSKIEKDDKGKSDRTLIATTDDKRYVVYAWWQDGAKRYHQCMATLEKEVMDAAPAFEKACKAVAISGEH